MRPPKIQSAKIQSAKIPVAIAVLLLTAASPASATVWCDFSENASGGIIEIRAKPSADASLVLRSRSKPGDDAQLMLSIPRVGKWSYVVYWRGSRFESNAGKKDHTDLTVKHPAAKGWVHDRFMPTVGCG